MGRNSKKSHNNSNKTKESKPVALDGPEEITLWGHPLMSVKILIILACTAFMDACKLIWKHFFKIAFIFGGLAALWLVPGSHTPYVITTEKILVFAGWWILLGVASSIGLGTGLHTFVLYLGPYIAKVALVAQECNYVPDLEPNRWEFESFAKCPNPKTEQISLWNIIAAVQLESFLWGLGTALGELPPYFVARASRLAGKTSEEIDEMSHTSGKGIIEKIKLIIYRSLQKYGFVTVLVCASIPNPLFDLAGITCGHFLIPFWTFFGATFFGKAIVKVHIQMIFVILMFSAHHIEQIISFVEANLPFLKHSLTNTLEREKAKLHDPTGDEGPKPLIAQVWELIVIGMIAFFVVSILNSLVHDYYQKERKMRADKVK